MAKELGFDSVRRLVDSVDPDELAQWMALAVHDGWGEERERNVMLRVTIHNAIMLAAAKQGAKVDEHDIRTPDDYLPPILRRKRTTRPDDMPLETWMRRMAGVHHG